MFCKPILLLLFFCAMQVSAQETVLSDPDFEQGDRDWNLPSGFRIVKGAGRNATNALRYERRDKKEYSEIVRDFRLEPNQAYRIGCWVKGAVDDPGNHKLGATFSLAFYSGKKLLNRLYLRGLDNRSTEWRFISKDIVFPPSADRCRITVYLSRDGLGEAFFDDFTIQPLNEFVLYPVTPGMGVLTVSNPLLKIIAYYSGTKPPSGLKCRLTLPGLKPFVSEVTDSEAVFRLQGVKAGKTTARVELSDSAGKILAERSLPLEILPSDEKIPSNACVIDDRGRAVVGGKPFLPIGVFVGHIRDSELERIAEGAFNCIVPYASMFMRPSPNQPNSSRTSDEGVTAIRKALDAAHRKNLKVLFSLQNVYDFDMRFKVDKWYEIRGSDNIVDKVVPSLKDHPAILGWYINDERALSQLDTIRKRREQINALDRFHPTWSLSMQFTMMYRYAPTGDVLGSDPYPIADASSKDMAVVELAGTMTRKTGMPHWAVPQLFRFGGVKDFDKYRDPSEEELRAMCLNLAINGATGFIFYHFNDIACHEKEVPGYFARRWEELKRVASMLRELEPYLLSDHKPQELTMQVRAGKLKGAAFRNANGKYAVLITAEGPGPAEGTFVLDRKLRSKYGKTVPVGNGIWRFTGKDICGDLLIEE